MLRKRLAFTLLLSTVSLSYVVGCSSSDSSGNPSGSSGNSSGSSSGSSTSGTSTTTVSFANDIAVPIFQASCSAGGSACHGDTSVTTQPGIKRPYLGLAGSQTPTATEVRAILAGLVGQPSAEDTTMPLVTAFDPTKSYLIYKMDGTQATLSDSCKNGDYASSASTPGTECGLFMPYTTAILPQATRDKVRTWITEGAQNN